MVIVFAVAMIAVFLLNGVGHRVPPCGESGARYYVFSFQIWVEHGLCIVYMVKLGTRQIAMLFFYKTNTPDAIFWFASPKHVFHSS